MGRERSYNLLLLPISSIDISSNSVLFLTSLNDMILPPSVSLSSMIGLLTPASLFLGQIVLNCLALSLFF